MLGSLKSISSLISRTDYNDNATNKQQVFMRLTRHIIACFAKSLEEEELPDCFLVEMKP